MRNRYLDLLRAVAIVRVIVYHHFGWAWLSIVFPAMGVMFAVAGSLTAASLQRRSAGQVVTSRMRRLLPPVWLFGLITVPAMLYTGWTSEVDGEHPFQPATLLFWVLPLGDPPGSDQAAYVWDALWYVRTYLWLVLLSPLLYPLFRRIGWPLLAVPLLLMMVLERGDFGMPAGVESALWDLATYGACWIAGFAHRDGRLARLRPGLAGAAFAVLAGTGLYWLWQGHAETGWDLNEASEAQAVYSLAFVLLALRWQPPMDRIERLRHAGQAITLFNARAVTIYLWHGVAIAAVWPILERTGMDDLGRLEAPVTLGVTFAIAGLAVLMFGWAEDLAAGRRPRLWPAGGDPAPAASEPVASAEAEPIGRVPAGWPEVPRDAARPATGTPGPPPGSGMPVAGRPVPGFSPPADAGFRPVAQRHHYDGVPWAGHSAATGGPNHPAPLTGHSDHS
ncbi:acyltransferase family protein [Actinoplanes aureus]|uniref:Acyltransferase n=1 Tax=Actinoplanes aureus TaxID=2792083 RepID=A0A931FYQ3_9ACTN|nr:acyltransferase [Actinoplanes aureus]MBG0562156.1 acyltransferase [Actinoplanes aureus]